MRRLFPRFGCCLLPMILAGCELRSDAKKDAGPTIQAKRSSQPTAPSPSNSSAPKVSSAPGTKPVPAAPKLLAVDPLDWPNWRGPEQNRICAKPV